MDKNTNSKEIQSPEENQSKTWIIHPLLFALYPIVFLLNHNAYEMVDHMGDIFKTATFVLMFAGLLWLSIKYLVRDRYKSAISVSWFFFFFFSFKDLYGFINKLFLVNEWGVCFIWLVIFSTGIYWLIKTKKNLEKLNSILNVAWLVIIIFSVYECGYKINRLQRKKFKKIGPKITKEKPQLTLDYSPDVYYIILDGYVRSDLLKELFDHDNSYFTDYLKKKGFFVAEKSRSNYCLTLLSLPASLNMVYLDEIAKKMTGSMNYDPVIKMVRSNYVVNQLKQWGYQFVTFDTGVHTGIKKADIFLGGGYFNEFEVLLLNATPLGWVMQKTNLSPYEVYRKRILNTFDQLAEIPKMKGPKFVFAHFISPHPPFVFDANGNPLTPNRPFSYNEGYSYHHGSAVIKKEYIKGYRGEIEFISKKTQEVVEKILANSANPPIIIIQGDHGSGLGYMMSFKQTDCKERLSIFNAYYFPGFDRKKLYHDITPVNTFAILFNHYFGTKHPIRKDKSYFSSVSRPYKFIDVTEKIKK